MQGAVHLTGWLAVLALLASLATSLTARWWRARRAKLLAMRRLLGLAGFVLALLHAVLVMGGLLAPRSGSEAAALFAGLPYLRHGALALVLLAPLALTSFPRLNARLGLRTWSALHRLFYGAIVLAVLHVLAGPSADPRLVLALAVVVAALLAGRVLPSGRSRPPDAETDADSQLGPGRDEGSSSQVTRGSSGSP